MTVAVVAMMKNEEDVAYGWLAPWAGEAVDHVLVLDNGSTDNSVSELQRAAADTGQHLVILPDPETAYYQSKKMSRLAELAVEQYDVTWVIPADLDELWVCKHDRVGVWLQSLPPGAGVVTADLYNHFPSSIDPPGDNPFETIGWRQKQPGPLPKVAFRWQEGAVIAQGNHDVFGVDGARVPGLEIRHFPYRSAEQFVRKARQGAAAYAATDLPPETGAHWRSYGQILEQHGEDALLEVFYRWFWFLSPVDGGLIYDPAPYRRWVKNDG